MNIIDKFKLIEDLGYIEGCTDEQIEDAEHKLDMTFPSEFKEYTKIYGCIDFKSTEWTGLNIDGHLNVVDATIKEKKYNSKFPDKHFVLENYNIDNIIAIVNENGEVFLMQYESIKKICNNISEYLDICMQR